MRDVLILIYGSMLAFLFGIAGSLIGNAFDVFVKSGASLFYIIIIVFVLIIGIFREIVRVFGIGKTKSDQVIFLDDAHTASSDFYERHKGEYILRLKDESSLRESIILLFQLSLLFAELIAFFLFLFLGLLAKHPFALVFLIVLILLHIFSDRLQNEINIKILNWAKSRKAKIDFLLRSGELFSSFREYHLIFDFKDNTCYFVYFDKEEGIEKKIKDEIAVYLRSPRFPRAS